MTVVPVEAAPPPVGRSPRLAIAAVALGLGVLLVLFVTGLVLLPRYQAAHPPTPLQRSDAGQVGIDELYLDLTLVTPAFFASRDLGRYLGERDPASVLPFLVGLNTHTGSLEHLHHLGGELTLVGPDGHRYPALAEPLVLSQHHNAYLFLFPALDHFGRRFLDGEEGLLAVEAANVGGQALRRFEWRLPIDDGLAPRSWALRLGLVVALLAALLVVLSPCALELSLYYSAIISCTVAEGELEAMSSGNPTEAAQRGRRRVLRNLASFVAGFTLLYAASGATVGLVGEGVRQPLSRYGGAIQVVGGLLILYFALRVAGVDRLLRLRRPHPGARRSIDRRGFGRVLAAPGRLLTALRVRGQERARNGGTMRARDSFLVGLGLSSACLTCMGGAVLYPLLVYAGITSWSAGLVTLTLYSLGIAVPMVFIALGFFRIRLSLRQRLGWTRGLRMVSASLLAGVALLILSGQERVLTDVTFRLLAGVSQWVA